MSLVNQFVTAYYAILNDSRPNGLVECMDVETGEIDNDKYQQHSAKQRELITAKQDMFNSWYNEEVIEPEKKKSRKKRSAKRFSPYYHDENGTVVYLKPRQTIWFLLYVERPLLNCPRFHKKFRRRFRMPYNEFLKLRDRIKGYRTYFGRWMGCDAVGDKASPLELLLLGSLRYLGRGLTFDDLEEYTAISEELHRVFFHKFVESGKEELYPVYVTYPRNSSEFSNHTGEFNLAGMNSRNVFRSQTFQERISFLNPKFLDSF